MTSLYTSEYIDDAMGVIEPRELRAPILDANGSLMATLDDLGNSLARCQFQAALIDAILERRAYSLIPEITPLSIAETWRQAIAVTEKRVAA